VKRNRDRFPDDFMFRLTAEEAKAPLSLRSQIVARSIGAHERLANAPAEFKDD
jgi:hypothetical protein